MFALTFVHVREIVEDIGAELPRGDRLICIARGVRLILGHVGEVEKPH